MYVQFGLATQSGQYKRPVAIEVDAVRWHGLTDTGMLWDIRHKDGTMERITVGASKYGDFDLNGGQGRGERLVDILIIPWAPTISKDEFHAHFGKGMFMHPTRGHYVKAQDLPENKGEDNEDF